MATEVTSIGVAMETDGVERGIRTLQQLASQGPRVEKSMQGIEAAASKASIGLQNFGQGADKGLRAIVGVAPGAEQSLSRVGKSADESRKYIDSMVRSVSSMGSIQTAPVTRSIDAVKTSAVDASRAVGLLNSALALTGVGIGAKEIIALADGYTKFTAQLRLATKSADDYAASLNAVRRISADAQQGLAETGTLYARIANGTAELGLSQRRLSEITETVALGLKVSGATAAESASAMLQLSQAFASGVLRGEEFNAVNEAAPRLMKALADGIGVPVGALRELASEGKITSQVMAEALPKALADIRKEAEQIQTIGGSFTNLKNSLMEFIGAADQASGATKAISAGVNGLAANLDAIAVAAGGLALVLAGRYVSSTVAANAATTALAISTTRANIAAVALAASMSPATLAVTAFGAATRAASGALALFGGPIGLAVTAVGAAAAAFFYFRDSSEEVIKSLGGLNQPLDDLKKKLDNLPPEKRISVIIDIEKSGRDAIKQADNDIESLVQSVAGTANIKMPLDEFEKLTDNIRDTAKSGGDLTPILQQAAIAGNIPQNILQKWLDLAANIREANKAAANAAGAVGSTMSSAGGDVADVFIGKTDTALRKEAEAALKTTTAYKSKAEQMAEVKKQGDGLRKTLQELTDAGLGTSKEAENLRDRLKGVDERLASMAKSGKTAADGSKQVENSYRSLAEKSAEYVQSLKTEAEQGSKLTGSQKLQIELDGLMTKGKGKVSAAYAAQIQASIALAKKIEVETVAVKRAQEAYQDYLQLQDELSADYVKQSKAREAVRLSLDKTSQSLEDEAKLLELEESLIGRTSAARDIAIEKLKIERDLRKEIEAIDSNLDLDQATREEARARARENAAKKIALAERKVYVTEWEKTSQLIGDTLADYIMGGGKDAAQYLKRLFSTLVLQPIVQAGVGALFGTGSGQAAGAAAGANPFNLVQSGQSLWSSFSGGLTGALGTNIATIGSMIGSSAATAFGSGIVAGGNLGLFGGGIGQGLSMIGSGAAGSTAAGLGTLAGAALPWVAGAAALYSIIKGFDNSGTPHMGAGAIYSGGMLTEGRDIYNRATFGMGAAGEWSSSNQSAISGIASALGGALDGFAKTFGKETGYSIKTAFADDSSKDGAWGSLRIADAVGNVLVDWENTRSSKWAPREFANGEEGFQQYLDAVATDVKDAFFAMDLPAWADQLLNSATDLDTLNAALGQIAANKAGFDALASSMSIFKGITEDLQTQLLSAAGSMESLTSVAGSYYGSSLFSEQERMLAARQQQMNALSSLGILIDPAQGDKAKEQFRAVVEQAMSAGQGELAVKLMSMSSSFAQVADYAQQAMDDIAEAAKDAADASSQAHQTLLQSASQVLAAMPGGASESINVQAQLLAEQAAKIWSIGADELQGIILQSSASDIERYLREAWSYLDTTEAKQALVDLGGQLVEFAKQADQAAAQQRGASFASSWSTLAGASGLAAQYTGNAAGLNAQLAIAQGSYATAGNTADRLAALQESITIEQSIWNLQQKQRQAEADAIRASIEAAQQQLSAQRELLNSAKSLGKFADDLFSGEQSGLSTTERLASLQAEYQSLLGRARTGDVEAIGQLQGVSTDYLRLAQKTSVSGVDYSVLSGTIAAQLASVSAIQQASATSQAKALEDQISKSQQQADSLSAAQFSVSDQTRVAIESLLSESIDGFQEQLRGMHDLAGLTEDQITAMKQWPAALNGIMSATLVPSIESLAQSASSSAVSAFVAANAAAEDQRLRRAAELVADQLRMQLAAAQAAAEAAAQAAIASAAASGASIPAFANGGMHAGGVRLVGEFEPEVEVTGPARYFNSQQMRQMMSGGGDNSQLIAENRKLLQRVADLEAHMVRVADASERLADMFENSTAGGNAMAVEVMRLPA